MTQEQENARILTRLLSSPTDWREELKGTLDVRELSREEWDVHGNGRPLPSGNIVTDIPWSWGPARNVWHITYKGDEFARAVHLKIFRYEGGNFYIGLGHEDYLSGWRIDDKAEMASLLPVVQAGLLAIEGGET